MLCTFHLFAERGVQSGRDRGYVRARRQPSSFLGDENETYTKIIEEMASFQLYNFVSPLPNPPHMLSTFLLLLTTGGLCNCTRRGQSTGKCFLTIYTNSVLHLYISDFVILLILISSQVKIVYKFCWCSSRICDVFTDTTSRCQFLDFVLT